jgi:sec-independent protein translocase protein TatA
MVGDILQPTHLLFVLLVALLVLGPKRLPEVGRTLGSGLRDFREALSGETSHDRYEHHEPETVQAPPEQRHQPAAEPEPLAVESELAPLRVEPLRVEPDPVVAQAAPPAEAAPAQPVATVEPAAADARTEPHA